MMITSRRPFVLLTLAAAAASVIACDGGQPSRTADEFAADSALAADLALANRDTLLVDSIGAYRPPETIERPGADTTPAVASETAPPPPAPAPAPAAIVAEPASAKKAAAPAARLSGTRACSSPTMENQNECLRALLPAADARLTRIYRALITEMRRQEGVPGGARDPASVQRLRVAQRTWLVYRDNECRKRGRGTEGARWARPRVRCLGQFADRRANELADDFSRLTAGK